MAEKTELCLLFEEYRADKCEAIGHNYSVDYFELLNPIKHTLTNMLEIGIGNAPLMNPYVSNYIPGASIKAWRDFFPNATVYAVDILEDVMFEDDRIKTYVVDQSSTDSLKSFIDEVKVEFDFIIDDGSHNVAHQITSIHELSKSLKTGGLYIIEDVAPWWQEQLTNEIVPNMEIIKNRGEFIVYKKL